MSNLIESVADYIFDNLRIFVPIFLWFGVLFVLIFIIYVFSYNQYETKLYELRWITPTGKVYKEQLADIPVGFYINYDSDGVAIVHNGKDLLVGPIGWKLEVDFPSEETEEEISKDEKFMTQNEVILFRKLKHLKERIRDITELNNKDDIVESVYWLSVEIDD